MKIPVQPTERPQHDKQTARLGQFERSVAPAGPIECMLCKAACQLLPEPGKSACLLVCDATVC